MSDYVVTARIMLRVEAEDQSSAEDMVFGEIWEGKESILLKFREEAEVFVQCGQPFYGMGYTDTCNKARGHEGPCGTEWS